MSQPLVQVNDLHKHYRMGSEDLHVLRGVDMDVDRGQWLGIFGRSGSGKSTLLHLIGGLDTPDQGKVIFDEQNVFGMSSGRRDQFRNRRVGFVFQFYHLLPELNVLENTTLTCMIGTQGESRLTARQHAADMLEHVGLGDRLKHRPNELSGGERQRVAIARALANRPDVLLADEPTGNLDKDTGQRILELFASLHASGQTIIMVSHDPATAERADRVLTLESGQLVR